MYFKKCVRKQGSAKRGSAKQGDIYTYVDVVLKKLSGEKYSTDFVVSEFLSELGKVILFLCERVPKVFSLKEYIRWPCIRSIAHGTHSL